MKFKELREKSIQDLEKIAVECKQEKFNLKIQKGIGQLTKPDRIKKVRKQYAQVLTLINQKKRS